MTPLDKYGWQEIEGGEKLKEIGFNTYQAWIVKSLMFYLCGEEENEN